VIEAYLGKEDAEEQVLSNSEPTIQDSGLSADPEASPLQDSDYA
jgi:hypothetical protein